MSVLPRTANELQAVQPPGNLLQRTESAHSYTSKEQESSPGIGGSIRRKLQEVKDVSTQLALGHSFKRRPRSTSRAPIEDSHPLNGNESNPVGFSIANGKRDHHHKTDILPARPVVHHSISVPANLLASAHSPPLATSRSFSPELSREQRHIFAKPEQLASTGPEDAQHDNGVAQDSSMVDVTVPQLLQQGVPMLKVSAKKQKRYVFKLDPDQGQIVWESKKLRIIPIENIKELREGADARYYREQFQLAAHFEDRWLTIVYVLDGGYKTLHLIAGTHDVFQMWDITLRRLYAIRQKLMSGLGDTDVRQAVWEKQFWRSAAPDTGADQKLDFDEVERLCRRMNINPSREDLWARFTEADSMNRGYLDFADFQRFVKALKARPEIESLYKRLSAGYGGLLTYDAFERFMRTSQMSLLSQGELQRVFLRYASKDVELSNSAASSPAQNSLEIAVKSAAIVEEPVRSSPTWDFDMHPSSSHSSATLVASSSSQSSSAFSLKSDVMSIKGFTTFLLSADNSAFADQHGKIYHDMSRPLPEYFVSSSHNTYLVGHQLVGESTIEGYIRALLHSCRSVELDIYDGDVEPVVYHGRTLTTKVLLRDACAAINKYAFVASPYPIIISAEIHCSVPQQELIASIMHAEFGEALLSAPIDGRPKIDVLPSPEDLKGRILLKAKNLYVSDKDDLREKEISVDTESSSTETSASDMDLADEAKQEWRKAREAEAELIKDLKYEFKKARNTFGRVHPHRTELTPNMSPSPRSDARDLPPASQAPQKVKMSFALVALLVYTVGVKCRGLNKKEVYAPEHMFSLSESTANRILKHSMMDLIKHNKTHLVRIYPKGTRIGSTNFEPHRYWSAGAQLVAINWQTLDLGYMINHAMFQRNGRAGYVLKPLALRTADKQLMSHRSRHCFEVTVISAQQLPRPKNLLGREALDRSILDPYVEVSLHVPDWTQAHNHIHSSELSQGRARTSQRSPASAETGTPPATTSARTVTVRTAVVRNNGFNPVWDQQLSIPFDLVGDMRDLVFVRFAVKQEGAIDEEPLAIYCASMGSLNMGYRHLPLHDAQLSQYLFSTLFVKLGIHDL